MNYSIDFKISGAVIGSNTIDMPEGTVAGATLRWDSLDNDDQVTGGSGTVSIPTGTFTLPSYVNTARSVQITITQNVAFADEDNLTVTASVTALPAGATPTVTASKPSAKTRNFAFGLPKGDKGDKGDQGAASAGVTGQCFIPFVISSRGTVGINGAITTDKATTGAYPACYMYFADGALWKAGNGNATANPAGWYFTKLTTTTTGTVYKDRYVSGKPTIPATPAAIVQPTAVGSWVPQPLQTFARVLIPANSLGANGAIRLAGVFSSTYETYSTDMRISFGGVELTKFQTASSYGTRFDFMIGNAGDAKRQVQNQGGSFTKFTNIDTTVDQYVEFSGGTQNPTDVIALEWFSVQAMPFN